MSTHENLSDMQPIENKILEIIKEQETHGQNQDMVIRLEVANDAFEELVERGVVRKRGYNLAGINNMNDFKYRFEAQV